MSIRMMISELPDVDESEKLFTQSRGDLSALGEAWHGGGQTLLPVMDDEGTYQVLLLPVTDGLQASFHNHTTTSRCPYRAFGHH
jgi:hypothetical protein